LKPHLFCIGGEDHCLRIAFLLALRDRGFRISAAGTGDPAPFARVGLDYHRFHFDRFFNPAADWVTLKTISKLIAELQPRLVQCFDTKPCLLVPLAARGLRDARIVSTINGLGWLYSSHSPLALGLRPVYQALQRLAARSTAVTVFQNRDDQAFFADHQMAGREGHLLIPGSGIDIERFEQAVAAGPSPAQLRHALGLGACEVVLTVTRLARQKGIPTLLEAAALVHQRRPGVRFLLVGPRENEGPLAVTQDELDCHAPYVLAVGPRSDVPALLHLADVFVCPTELREGIPRALLEAAVAGCPVVTTAMPGCNDVIRDGWNGFLVPPRAPLRLANRILDLLRDRATAETMGARAATFARHEFNLEVTVARYAAVYEELLNGTRPRRRQSADAVDHDFTRLERERPREALRSSIDGHRDSGRRMPAASCRRSDPSRPCSEP
jgi:glycosyltransferase involved in cell wall biosynthesis